MHVYEVRPRNDGRGFDLISGALPFGRLWYAGPNAVANAIGYAEHRSRSHDAVIRVYDCRAISGRHYLRQQICDLQSTVTATGAEGMPLATTTSWLGPRSWVAGTSK
jgi:hypothetical protein